MKRKATTSTKQTTKKLKESVLKITEKQLNHYTFKKQGLIERKEFEKIPNEYLPLHGTSHTTPYLSLFARMKNVSSDDISIHFTGKQVEYPLKRCMRGTLHIVPTEQLSAIHSVYGSNDAHKFEEKQSGFEQGDIEQLLTPILTILKEKGPLSTASIKQYIDPNLIKTNKYKTTNVTYAMKFLYRRGDIEYGATEFEEKKDWKDSNRKYSLTTIKYENMDFSKGIKELGNWYFSVYGPASFKDFVWWSGLQVTKIRKDIEEILKNFEKIEVNKYPIMYISKNELNELKEISDEYPKFIKFLPYEDAMVKAYKETRCRFFNDKIDKLVMKRGELMPSVWKNGTAIGLFNWSKNSNFIIKLFEKEIEKKDDFIEELNLLKEFLGFEKVEWEK